MAFSRSSDLETDRRDAFTTSPLAPRWIARSRSLGSPACALFLPGPGCTSIDGIPSFTNSVAASHKSMDRPRRNGPR
jgi:hypothetical protein